MCVKCRQRQFSKIAYPGKKGAKKLNRRPKIRENMPQKKLGVGKQGASGSSLPLSSVMCVQCTLCTCVAVLFHSTKMLFFFFRLLTSDGYQSDLSFLDGKLMHLLDC